MWVLTQHGFVSVTAYDEAKGGKRENASWLVVVRARVKEDLQRLLGEGTEILDTPDRDYPFRAIVDKGDFAEVMGREVARIDYTNFKDRVREVAGPERAHVYHQVWAALLGLAKPAAATYRKVFVPGYIRQIRVKEEESDA